VKEDGQRHTPAVLAPAVTWYPLYGSQGGPQGRSVGAENIDPTELWSPDRPARSKSLFWLTNPGPHNLYIYIYEAQIELFTTSLEG